MTRINARPGDESAAKLDFLRRRTQLSTSELLKMSLTALHAQTLADKGGAAEILEKTGFIGCASRGKNLSRDDKAILTRELNKKHGHR